jgi:hypothetical protein
MVPIVLLSMSYLVLMSSFTRSVDGAPRVPPTVDGVPQIAWGMSEGYKMISRPSEQPSRAFSIGCTGEAISYPSQHSSDFTWCVRCASEVRVQVSHEERVFSA